jgi:hypothetical protein
MISPVEEGEEVDQLPPHKQFHQPPHRPQHSQLATRNTGSFKRYSYFFFNNLFIYSSEVRIKLSRQWLLRQASLGREIKIQSREMDIFVWKINRQFFLKSKLIHCNLILLLHSPPKCTMYISQAVFWNFRIQNHRFRTSKVPGCSLGVLLK